MLFTFTYINDIKVIETVTIYDLVYLEVHQNTFAVSTHAEQVGGQETYAFTEPLLIMW